MRSSLTRLLISAHELEIEKGGYTENKLDKKLHETTDSVDFAMKF